MTMIQLLVDDEPVDVTRMEMHFQEDPWPGGSTYCLQIRDEDVIGAIRSRFDLGTYTQLGGDEVSFVFMRVRLTVSLKYSRSAPHFWANSVHVMRVAEDEITLRGTCSPHVQNRRQ